MPQDPLSSLTELTQRLSQLRYALAEHFSQHIGQMLWTAAVAIALAVVALEHAADPRPVGTRPSLAQLTGSTGEFVEPSKTAPGADRVVASGAGRALVSGADRVVASGADRAVASGTGSGREQHAGRKPSRPSAQR